MTFLVALDNDFDIYFDIIYENGFNEIRNMENKFNSSKHHHYVGLAWDNKKLR